MKRYSVLDFDVFNDYKSFMENRREIKKVYKSFLFPFFNRYKVKRCRDILYQKDISTKRKEIIWSYLNGDSCYDDLKRTLNNSAYNTQKVFEDYQEEVINEILFDQQKDSEKVLKKF